MQNALQSRPRPFAALFLDHPATVNEGYFEHMRFALGFAFWLGLGAACAIVHALVPGLCVRSARKVIYRLHARIEKR